MPTIQVISDLHLEQYRDGGAEFVNSMDPAGVDILALAGDVISARFPTHVRKVFEAIAAKYPQVLYVPGNHELWGGTPKAAMTGLANALAPIKNVTMLNNQLVTLDGRRFLGGPMWFPQWSVMSDYAATQMSDFTEIEGFREWVVKENAKFKTFIQENLQEGDVVLTHYLPSTKSLSPRWQGSATNPFFVCEMDSLIHEKKPALWIHGHTHDSAQYQLASTRVVCNPFGYPTQLNQGYTDKLLVTVD